jgi:hypothetical protein
MSRGNRGIVSRGRIFTAALVGMLTLLAAATGYAAKTITVTTTSDSCTNCRSLRDAINTANADTGDIINFKIPGTGPFTIKLTSDLPNITSSMTISGGTSQATGITIDINQNLQAAFVDGATTTLNLNNLTIENGNNPQGNGGAINIGLATVNVTNCAFLNNSAEAGSAFAVSALDGGGVLNVTNSTFSGNSGSAIWNVGTTSVTHSTFFGNPGPTSGAITNFGGVNLEGSIMTASSGGNCFNGAGTAINDYGYNFDDDGTCVSAATSHTVSNLSSFLGPLANNGGPTMTFAELPGPGNPTIDAIPFASCTYLAGTLNPCTNPPSTTPSNQLTCDQRGFVRPINGTCSAGAYQYASVPRIDCSPAVASNPNLTALLPFYFMPEYVFGVNDYARPYNLKITGVTQDKAPTGLPLCPNAFWSGTTTYVRTNNEPLQPGPSSLQYQIEFTATDTGSGVSCKGSVPVCVQGVLDRGQPCTGTAIYDATSCR